MTAKTNSAYQSLIEKLDQFIRKYYKNQLLRGSIYAASLLIISYLIITTLEYFGQFDSLVRTLLFYSFLISALAILIRMVMIPLFRLNRLGKTISHEEAAQIIGDHFSDVQDKLFNVLQLKQQAETKQSSLLEASIEQKILRLKPVPFTAAIDLSANRKYIKYLIPPILILLLIGVISPGILQEGSQRLIAHNTQFKARVPFTFTLQNESLEGIKNEDFELSVKIDGEALPSKAYIVLNGERFLMNKQSATDYFFRFKNIQEDQEFYLSADGYNSDRYALKSLPKPLLIEFEATINYPDYTGKKDEVLRNSGDLTIPQGTQIRWRFQTQDTEVLTLIQGDSSQALNRIEENAFTYEQRYFQRQSYGLTTSNEFLKAADTINYSLNVIPDLYPSIEVEKMSDSLDQRRFYFKGFIKDDYGFSRLLFHYRYSNDQDSATALNSEELSINRSLSQFEFFHVADFSEVPLSAGDRIEFYFEVWDNDGINGSKSSRTHRMQFRAPDKEELQDKAKAANKEIKAELEKSIELTKEIKRDLDELNRKMLDKKSLGWQEKKKLEELLKKQEQVQKTVEQFKEKNSQKNREQESFRKMDEEIIAKQERLEELFEQVMSEEMKEMMQKMEEMMEKLNKDQLKDALEQMELSNEDLEKELDRSLELFKQLELEQKINDTKEKLDELAEKQEKLSEESKDKKADSEALEKKQEELNKEFDEIRKDLDEIEQKNENLEQPNDFEKTDELEESTEEDMQESKEQLSDGKSQKASESQENASEKMKQLSEQMGNMQMEMQGGANAENLDDLRAILENLITLSFDQESLMKNLKQTDRNDPKYVEIAQEQKKLKDDAKIIEDSLFALSKRVIQLESIVNREIGLINHNMDKAIEMMGDRLTPNVTSRQQLSMTSMNNLALLLDEAVQQMQKQMQMQGNGSCSKPGSNGKPSSAANMKKLQQQLNQQMQKMQEAMEKGKQGKGKKGDQPGGSGQNGGMSKELAKMAAKQAAIRREIQRMQEQMGKEGEQGGAGGLKKLSELMEETETDLVNKRLSQETLKRQQDILTRLLESEKAEREREKDERREAEESKNDFNRNPNSFFEYNKQKEKEIELLKTLPPTFNSFYKTKVAEYFKNVEK